MGISNMDDSSNDETLYQLADLFKVFGDPTRIRILAILSKQEIMCAGHCRFAVHDTECDFSSAADSQAVRTGKISPGWKNHLLLSCR